MHTHNSPNDRFGGNGSVFNLHIDPSECVVGVERVREVEGGKGERGGVKRM